jgi:hypothetical protein
MQRGELSRAQADEIAGAASADPGAERSLLDSVAGSSLTELRERCARTRAAADPDRNVTHRRIHRERRLRRWTDAEGAWNLSARGTPDAGSRFNAALNPIIDELFRAARREGRRESREAYAFDALIELARRRSRRAGDATDPADAMASGTTPTPGGVSDTAADAGSGRQPARSSNPTHLALIRIDLEALVRGRVEGDELSEIAGVGPIPVTTARDLLGDSIVKLVITNGIDVANVTHLGRGPTAAQRVALLWNSAGCVVHGCSRTIGIETDHRVPWADDRVTELANLDRLCGHHHDLKTRHGWALVPGAGKRLMVPPGDEHHPANQSPNAPPTDPRPPPSPTVPESTQFGDAA